MLSRMASADLRCLQLVHDAVANSPATKQERRPLEVTVIRGKNSQCNRIEQFVIGEGERGTERKQGGGG